MRITDAVQLALREFADPACRRCRGRGYVGDLRPDAVCRCVVARVPPRDAEPADDDPPHPWPAITRRAQQIHAAALLELTPVFERAATTIDRDRFSGELAEVEANLERVRSRLGNPGFTEKAPPAVIDGARRQLAELEARRERLVAVLGPSAGS